MTAYRMVDSEHVSVRQILRDMEKFQHTGQHILSKPNVINVSIIHKCMFLPGVEICIREVFIRSKSLFTAHLFH